MSVVKIKVSKNRYLGAQVRSVEDIAQAAKDRLSLTYYHTGLNWKYLAIRPAAVWINYQGRILVDYIQRGCLYYCVKEEDF